jgi:hypothetical protein
MLGNSSTIIAAIRVTMVVMIVTLMGMTVTIQAETALSQSWSI